MKMSGLESLPASPSRRRGENFTSFECSVNQDICTMSKFLKLRLPSILDLLLFLNWKEVFLSGNASRNSGKWAKFTTVFGL